MNTRTNLPLSAHTSKVWYTTATPNVNQMSARNALNIMMQCGVEESKIALRDSIFCVVLPDMGLLYDIFALKTKDGVKKGSYTLSTLHTDKPHMVVFRILNGELYSYTDQVVNGQTISEEKVDVYAWTEKQLADQKLKSGVIGLHSDAGREMLKKAADTLTDPRDKARFEGCFQFFPCDCRCGFQIASWRQVVEVTQEMMDAGLTTIVDDYSESGEATALGVGDFLVITDDGMYRIDRKTFVRTHTTFKEYR